MNMFEQHVHSVRRIEHDPRILECVLTTTAKTNAERQRDFRQRKADTESIEVRGIFAHPDDHQAVKDEADKINRRRVRATKRAAI